MKKCNNRSAIALAAVTVALFAGIHGLRAQGQTSMVDVADGLDPPDPANAYERPVRHAAAEQQHPFWPELEALLSDPNGMNAPGEGFAYALPLSAESLVQRQDSDTQGLVYDADGLEPPDIGVAYEIISATAVAAWSETKTK